MLTLKSTLRVGTVAVGLLLIGTVVAEAAAKDSSSTQAQQKCRDKAKTEFKRNMMACADENGYDIDKLAECQAMVLDYYHSQLEACDSAIVGRAEGLLGEFGDKGTTQVMPGTFQTDLRGADTSGGHGGSDVAPSGSGGSGNGGANATGGLGHFSSANGGAGGGTIY